MELQLASRLDLHVAVLADSGLIREAVSVYMSGTQLVIPESREDSAVLERFVEGSKELVPGVQVRLAKRIVRPGSNRVLCLAATTSGPLDEDAQASVSNLALRLSDGTNVVLSLSFFNDLSLPAYAFPGAGAGPVNHYVNEPGQYAAPDDGRFFKLVLALVLGTLAGLYSLGLGPFSGHGFWNPGLEASSGNRPRHGSPVARSKVRPPKVTSTRTTELPVSPAVVNTAPDASKSRLKTPHLKLLKLRDLKPASMMIPPPPPITYSLPYPPAYAVEQPQSVKPVQTAVPPGSLHSAARTESFKTAALLPGSASNPPQLERLVWPGH